MVGGTGLVYADHHLLVLSGGEGQPPPHHHAPQPDGEDGEYSVHLVVDHGASGYEDLVLPQATPRREVPPPVLPNQDVHFLHKNGLPLGWARPSGAGSPLRSLGLLGRLGLANRLWLRPAESLVAREVVVF